MRKKNQQSRQIKQMGRPRGAIVADESRLDGASSFFVLNDGVLSSSNKLPAMTKSVRTVQSTRQLEMPSEQSSQEAGKQAALERSRYIAEAQRQEAVVRQEREAQEKAETQRQANLREEERVRREHEMQQEALRQAEIRQRQIEEEEEQERKRVAAGQERLAAHAKKQAEEATEKAQREALRLAALHQEALKQAQLEQERQERQRREREAAERLLIETREREKRERDEAVRRAVDAFVQSRRRMSVRRAFSAWKLKTNDDKALFEQIHVAATSPVNFKSQILSDDADLPLDPTDEWSSPLPMLESLLDATAPQQVCFIKIKVINKSSCKRFQDWVCKKLYCDSGRVRLIARDDDDSGCDGDLILTDGQDHITTVANRNNVPVSVLSIQARYFFVHAKNFFIRLCGINFSCKQ